MDTKFSTGLGAVRRTSLDANSANLKEWGRDDTVLDRHLGKTGAYVQTVGYTRINRFSLLKNWFGLSLGATSPPDDA